MATQNATTPNDLGAKHAMIVDDEPGVRMLLGLILQNQGYEVSASSNGEQAWEELVTDPGKWDLVITDERMPLLSGSGLVRRMREAGMGIPVLLVSGFLADSARITSDRADGLLHKPFELEEVIAMVETLQGVTHPSTPRR